MNNLKLINIKLKSISQSIKAPVVMFPVSKFWEACSPFYPKLLRFCMNRSSRLTGRARIGLNFITHIKYMDKHHGPTFTVKWMKACSVCLQKFLGGEELTSLRAIEQNLPLPRLINGLPAYISKSDRHWIRQGDVNVIRFWLTMFALYRVIQIPGVLKLSTITDAFTGDINHLNQMNDDIISGKYPIFNDLRDLFKKENLAPKWLFFSTSSSPSSKVSFKGVLTDIALLEGYNVLNHEGREGDRIKANHNLYLSLVGTIWNIKRWQKNYSDLAGCSYYSAHRGRLAIKGSTDPRNGLSQFAFKDEAAGKIRVFALVDSITQSILRPLHDALFNLLKSLPNDGTFDQEASARRCVEKSLLYGKAYSFDLSAATDRLPVTLTASIFTFLSGIPGFGDAWQKVLTDRRYSFGLNSYKRYPSLDVHSSGLTYSVGQPMGALSSWAGLAITHHYILQHCANNLGINFNKQGVKHWYEGYEILGDDIVIFDSRLAEEYLFTMEKLGVDINLSKSIISHEVSTFEFAKRTYFKGANVSAVPIKMFLTAHGISGRIMLAWTALSAYRLTQVSVIGTLLSKATDFVKSISKNKLVVEPLGLLSLLANQGYVKQQTVVESIVNPGFGVDFDLEQVERLAIPSKSILDLAVQLFHSDMDKDLIHFSGDKSRKEWAQESIPFMVDEYLKLALYKIKIFNSLEMSITTSWYKHWLNESLFTDSDPEDRVYLAGLSGLFEENFTKGFAEDTSDLVDKYEDILYKHAKYRHVSLDDAIKHLEDVEIYILQNTIPVLRKFEDNRIRISEDSKVLRNIYKVVYPDKINYWDI